MALCLDFANTLRRGAAPRDQLSRYADLVAGARRAGALADAAARRLLGAARRRPAAATAALRRGLALREAIYRLLSAVADRRPPRGADLATVNAAVAGALALSRLGARGGGFAWDWAGDRDALDRPLWPGARSAGGPLAPGDLVAGGGGAAPRGTRGFVDRRRHPPPGRGGLGLVGQPAKAPRGHPRRRPTSARSPCRQ